MCIFFFLSPVSFWVVIYLLWSFHFISIVISVDLDIWCLFQFWSVWKGTKFTTSCTFFLNNLPLQEATERRVLQLKLFTNSSIAVAWKYWGKGKSKLVDIFCHIEHLNFCPFVIVIHFLFSSLFLRRSLESTSRKELMSSKLKSIKF